MLQAIWNKTWGQHPTKQQLYSYLPPITKTEVRWTRHAGYCWRSKDELVSAKLLWTPSHGQAKAGRPARTYIQQLCAFTGYSLEDLPGAMDDRDGWQERVWEIRAGSATWWWHVGTLITSIINIQEVLTIMPKHFPIDKMYSYFPLNKQYMKRVQ